MTDNVEEAMAVGMLPAPQGWVRNTDGRWEIHVGKQCPPDRSSGFSTQWTAVYDAPNVREIVRETRKCTTPPTPSEQPAVVASAEGGLIPKRDAPAEELWAAIHRLNALAYRVDDKKPWMHVAAQLRMEKPQQSGEGMVLVSRVPTHETLRAILAAGRGSTLGSEDGELFASDYIQAEGIYAAMLAASAPVAKENNNDSQ